MESDISAMHSMQGKSSVTLFKDLVLEYLYKEYRGSRLKEQRRKLGYWSEMLGEKLIIDITKMIFMMDYNNYPISLLMRPLIAIRQLLVLY